MINASTRRAALYKTLYPAEVVVNDTFTDNDATLITAHAPNLCPAGSVWVDNNLSYPHSIKSNHVYGDPLTGLSANFTIDSKLSDVQIDAVIYITYNSNVTVARQCGIVFRYGYGRAFFAVANYLAQQIQIVDYSNNILATTTWKTPKKNTELNARVILSGASITAIIDGDEVRTFCADNLNATQHGLRVYNATAYVDNFSVTAMR